MTRETISMQSAYDRIKAYFSKPGAELARVAGPGTMCYYRKDGRKCAGGVLIPDELYVERMEGTAFSGITGGELSSDDPAELKKLIALSEMFDDPGTVDFIDEVQSGHDNSLDVEDFLLKLDDVAIAHGVTP